MNRTFHLLEPLLAPEGAALRAMVAEIEVPVADRTAAYVGDLLRPLRPSPILTEAREALLSNDPYFIGAAHGRLRYDRDETVGVLEVLLGWPGAAALRWDDRRFAAVSASDGHQADRIEYGALRPASDSTVAAVADAFARIESEAAPFAVIVAGGTRRLAISAECVGSSSISSLPGYSMIQSPEEGQLFGARQLNGLVHEAVHGLLFLAECQIGRQFVREGVGSRVVSPWSGNPLDTYQFAQALVVWHVLLAFWSAVEPSGPERAAAARGFEGGNEARSVLASVRSAIEDDYLEILSACCDLSAGRA